LGPTSLSYVAPARSTSEVAAHQLWVQLTQLFLLLLVQGLAGGGPTVASPRPSYPTSTAAPTAPATGPVTYRKQPAVPTPPTVSAA
jgi:hypothetical protein